MAKEGVDYFPLDCQRDDKIKLIEAEFGIKGFAVVVKIWQRIYADRGYYCEWSEDVGLLFSDEIREGCSFVSEIVSASIKRDIFSRELYEKYGILTSRGIQKRYFEIVKRRTKVEVKKEYLLISADILSKNVYIIGENVYRNEENVCRNTQSKVKESKGKERKRVEKNIARGTYGHVLLSDEAMTELTAAYGAGRVDDYIGKVDSYCQKTGKSYSDYAYLIRSWIAEDAAKEKTPKPVKEAKQNRFHNFPQREYDWEKLEEKMMFDSTGGKKQ